MKYLLWIFLILLLLLRLLTFSPGFSDGQKVRITNRVVSDPIKYSYYQQVNLSGLKIYLPLYPEISYGDFVTVEGVVDGKALKNAVLINKKENQNFLYKAREKLLQNFKKSLPEPHASLIAGVTLGVKSGMPTNFWEVLKSTGTAHVVVASGMNVTLVASLLIGVLTLLLPRKKALVFAIAGVWLYALISGFDAPIIRAAIMGSIAFAAQKLGRVTFAWRGLFLSGLLMLIVNPSWVGDIGFILSFLATASILAFERKLNKTFSFLPKAVREGFSVSLAAQIAVAPVIFITFGQFNIASPVVNTLVAPVIAPLTIIGGIASLISLAAPSMGKLLTLLAYPLTSYFIWVVNFFN